MSQLILDPVLSGYNLAKVNDNFKRIEEAFNTLLLHKDGSKALTSDLDVNSQKLLNVGGIEIGGVDLLESIVSLQEAYSAYVSELEAYKSAVEDILEEAISYGAVDKKSIGNAQAVFTTSQAYAKNSNLTLPLKYIAGKNTLRLSLGHTYLLYKGVDYEEVGVVGEESQTIKIIRASGIGVGVTIEQVVDGDNDLYSIYTTATDLQNLLSTNYPPAKVEAFINSVSDVKELGLEDKISELWNIYNNLSALQTSFANTVADINTKYSTITDMYEDVSTKYSVLETLYPQLVALITDTNFDLNGLNAAVADILSAIQNLQALTPTIESNAQTASTAATSASTSAGEASNNASIASASATKAQIWAEGTDIEVEGILGEHSSKGWAEEAKRYATGNIIEALGYTPADDADLGALDAVAVKHTEQTLTTTQQAQARTNIDAVSSVELTAGLATKQGTLTFDTTPTANSSNPVTSQGIKAAIDAKESLPSQTGNAGKVLTTDGTTASWQPVQTRNIGEIVQSAIPLTDAGLHLLDGSLLPSGGVYDGFVQYINSLFVSQNPSLKWLPKEHIVLPTFSANTQNGITISDARGNTTNLQNIFNGTSEAVQVGLWSTYWINIDYAQNTLLTSYTIQADNTNSAEHPSAWVVNGSNDGETWETIDSQSGITFSLNQSKTFTVNPDKVYKQYRIVFSDGVLYNNDGEIRKISFDAYSAIYGYENSMFATEEQWQTCVAKYGVCSKFVVSTSGVRLPKLYSDTRYLVNAWKEGTEWYNLYSDGWCEQGGFTSDIPNNSSRNIPLYIEMRDVNFGCDTCQYGSKGFYTNHIVLTKKSVSSINIDNRRMVSKDITAISSFWKVYGYALETPDSEKIYRYICVATSVKTPVEVNIDNVITDMNGKLDKSGGTMTGNIYRDVSGKIFSIGKVTDANGTVNIDFGWDYSNRDGAGFGLRGASTNLESGQITLFARDASNSTTLDMTPTGKLKLSGYPLCSIKKASFNKSGVSGGDHTSVAITTPSGYTAIPVRVATIEWVGSPYVAGYNNSNVEVFWTHSGSGSVVVDVLFYKIFE